MKGGFGGYDIYVSKRLPNGKWGNAKNMGKTVNTKFDEESPYIFPDGVTLFFSSKGHKSMGGFDIFYSEKNKDKWKKPINIGYPINTTDDDIFYIPTADGKRAYYTSMQEGGFGESDLYLIDVKSNVKPLAVLTGKINAEEGTVPNSPIIIKDIKEEEEDKIFKPNPKTGKFIMILSPGKTYLMTCEEDGYVAFNSILSVPEKSDFKETQQIISIESILLGKSYSINSLQFSNSKSSINDANSSMLTSIAEVLDKNNDFSIEILEGANSNKMNVESIKKYLTSDNIDASRILNNFIMTDLKDDEIQVVLYKNNDKDKLLSEITKRGGKFKEVSTENNVATINPNSSKNIKSKYNGKGVENILFGFDLSYTSKYYSSLDNLASYLKDNTNATVVIEGYTDSYGNAKYNKILSTRRAKFIQKYLITKGVNKNNLTVKGFGEYNFISKNDFPVSRKYNRRVEFVVTSNGSAKLNIMPIIVPEEYKIK